VPREGPGQRRLLIPSRGGKTLSLFFDREKRSCGWATRSVTSQINNSCCPAGTAQLNQAGLGPLVSIIIPTYDYATYLPQAIQSCLDQSHKNIEVIVVDDGSTDDTREVVDSFGDRVVYLFQSHNGVSSARNAGLEQASGRFIAFLDADDYLMRDSVEIRLNAFFAHSDVDFVVTDTYASRMGSDGLRWDSRIRETIVSEGLCELLLSRRLPFATCAVLIRDHVAKRFCFPIDLANGEDIAYFSKLFFRRRGCFIPRPTAVTRSHPDSLRHRIDVLTKQNGVLVGTIFDDPYYQGGIEHLRRAFTAYRSIEFFRRFCRSGDQKAATAWLIRAITAKPSTALRIEYWIKLIRLHARKAVSPGWRSFLQVFRRPITLKERARLARFASMGLTICLIYVIGTEGFMSTLTDVIHPTMEDYDEFLFTIFAIVLYSVSLILKRKANRLTY
jgi:glycosyltransferase involved in cell wall biosynthesis